MRPYQGQAIWDLPYWTQRLEMQLSLRQDSRKPLTHDTWRPVCYAANGTIRAMRHPPESVRAN